MQVLFKILRQQADTLLPSPTTYTIETEPEQTILDCLNQIKWEQDGTLAFRKNCRNTICGSCAVRINGRSALACGEKVGAHLGDPPATIEIAPLGNLPVIKDLIVDMGPFWQNLATVDPYVSAHGRSLPEREFLQTPAQRDRLKAAGNCILCGACYSECQGAIANPNFVGPHALAKTQRTLADSRDNSTELRLKNADALDGVWGCTRCHWCNDVCPMEVAPLTRIGEVKQAILARPTAQSGRTVRHRKVLVELVKQGGWIDERRFGLQVVGDNGRDWRGLLGLLPLGLRMLVKGKFPLTFEPTTDVAEVRSLIEAIQQQPPAYPNTLNPSTMNDTPTPETPANESEVTPTFGWNPYAERLNGRFAMIGFVALLVLELFTGQGLLTWMGLR